MLRALSTSAFPIYVQRFRRQEFLEVLPTVNTVYSLCIKNPWRTFVNLHSKNLHQELRNKFDPHTKESKYNNKKSQKYKITPCVNLCWCCLYLACVVGCVLARVTVTPPSLPHTLPHTDGCSKHGAGRRKRGREGGGGGGRVRRSARARR